MARTLFLRMVLRKFSEITNKKPIFTIMNISFFSLRFDLFSIIVKEVNQIRNNVVCVVTRFVFLFCVALTTGRCNAFQHIFVNSTKSVFYGPYFQTMLFLVTMVKVSVKVDGKILFTQFFFTGYLNHKILKKKQVERPHHILANVHISWISFELL